ncbi:chemotaxis protein CheW [Caenimonas soli]|uniref:chemotaxis protein CheW n=1 Tax=Caenimonas soli TaxID=2735555 RepID=UPI001557DCDB|nr:chemotaxis protein CheW [Caenimonas soli]NPC58153.1 purine-binding chemotaxis protein CheW [Caenimonas soli]
MQFVVFHLHGQRFALPLESVDRIVNAVEVAPLPGAPISVLGAIDVGGRVLPVLCLRQRFGLPQRDVDPGDQFLIARTVSRSVVLVIDQAQGVVEADLSDVIALDEAVPGLEQFLGMTRDDDGLVLIHDLEKFLSHEESVSLDAALERSA